MQLSDQIRSKLETKINLRGKPLQVTFKARQRNWETEPNKYLIILNKYQIN